MKRKLFRFLSYLILPACLLFLVLNTGTMFDTKTDSAEYSEIVSQVRSGEIQEFTLNVSSGKMEYVKSDGKKYEAIIANPTFFHEDIGDAVSANGIKASYIKSVNYTTLLTIGSSLVMLLLGLFLLRKLSGKGGGAASPDSFGKIKDKERVVSTVRFSDIAGADEEKSELEEVVKFLQSPDKFVKAGARIPKGMLLVGPPGTGKTLLARAVAGEANVPFYSVSGSDFMEMFVGVGASRVRSLFQQAKKNSPSIIFIDEIDAIGRQRGTGIGGGHDEREQTLNQILVEMDGFTKNQNVIVMAATNRPDVLDKALLRPGRFDRQVVVNLPDVKGRTEILKIHGKNKCFDKDITPESIAVSTSGFSGADLENLLNEAALISVRNSRTRISQQDLDEAMLKIVMGTEKKSYVVSEEDKQITAFHEAGHAIVSSQLPTQDPVQQISIIPRGMASGFTLYKPKEERGHVSKQFLLDSICSLLGGRAAEEVGLGSICTGASNDIKRATELARQMVSEWGMSNKVGLVNYAASDSQPFLGKTLASCKNCSEDMARLIDQEVSDLISTQYNRAKLILQNNMDRLKAVSAVLVKKEKISGEEFSQIQ